MKLTFTTLSCALLLVGAARAQAKDPIYGSPARTPSFADADATFVGDNTDYVGDYEQARGAYPPATYVGDTNVAAGSGAAPQAAAAPAESAHSYGSSLPMTRAISSNRMSGAFADRASCDSRFPLPGASACNDYWLRSETLLWFTQERDTPPLVTTGPTLTNQFGNPLDSGMAPGFRLDYGKYFADGRFGLGARVWGLYGENEDYSISTLDPSNPTFNIQRPFFDTALNAPGALIVSGTLGPNQFDGSFDAESDLDILATEAYGRILFGQSSNYRIDLLGGYSHFSIDDDLTMRSTTRTVTGANIGQIRTFSDSFRSENRFHGGQIGFETMLNKGRWSMTSLTKVHLGNMNQQVRIDGRATDQIPAGPLVVADKGFFAQDQQGNHERDEFAFIPELNLKLGYAIRSNVRLTVGYSFLYWSSVAMAGDQLDPNINGLDLVDFSFSPPRAPYQIQEDGFWIQGIDLGVAIDF